jgi:uncharacterized repeat protein (TIGR02543 family)
MQYLANVAGNRQLYKKAYFLEFLGADGKAEDAFCFSLPPESEEITYTQRKTETKTFGGLHVDDYGIDAAKIVLSGSTVNQELKMIYRGDKEKKWLTGEEELYYLRDLIKKYKTGVKNLIKEIRLYDLSKVNTDGKGIIKNYWKVFIGDFKIRRSNDRPYTYKYSLELTCISRADGEEFASAGDPPPDKVIDDMKEELIGVGDSDTAESLITAEAEKEKLIDSALETAILSAESALETAEELQDEELKEQAEEIIAAAEKAKESKSINDAQKAVKKAQDTGDAEKSAIDKKEPSPPNEFVVHFTSSGGSPDPPPQRIKENEKLTRPASMTRSGFSFQGWFRDSGYTAEWDFTANPVIGDMTLYAKWAAVPSGSFNARFEGNRGEPNPNDQIVESGNKVLAFGAILSITKTACIFDGWYQSSDCSGSAWDFDSDSVTADITLYAKWLEREPQIFTVSFTADSGFPIPSPQNVREGEKASLPTEEPNEWEGYYFGGWFKDSGFSESWNFAFDTVTGDTILYAKWRRSASSYADDSSGYLSEAKKKASLAMLLRQARGGLLKAIDFVDWANGKVNGVLDYVRQTSDLLKLIGNIAGYTAHTVAGMVGSVGDAAAGAVDGGTRIIEGTHAVVSLPRSVQMQALGVGLKLQNASSGLVRETALLVKDCRDMFAEDGAYWQIPQETLDQYAMNNEEFKDSITIMLNRLENDANAVAVTAKSAEIPEVSVGNPDAETGEQRIVLSYGDTIVRLTSIDTLESLAHKYLGDPDKAIDIATYNSIASINDLKPGDCIKIPILARTGNILGNRIFARREDRDNYGRDIALDDAGRIITTSAGDYALTSGAENLSQAILLRLRESIAKRIRLNVYGIRTAIADPAAGIAYILSSIEQTVGADPRVSSVDDIRFSGRGDFLDVTVDYRDVNNSGGTSAGRV